jgi:hypothetical protein
MTGSLFPEYIFLEFESFKYRIDSNVLCMHARFEQAPYLVIALLRYLRVALQKHEYNT